VPEVLPEHRDGQIPLLAVEDDRASFAESYRSLRSAILFLNSEKDFQPKTLLITSAMQGDGKSTVAANLARALAMGGSHVLLVDADMRRGALHDRLGLERSPGLTDLLREPGLAGKVIHAGPELRRGTGRRRRGYGEGERPTSDLPTSNLLPNLSFIARGSDASNPGDLLLDPVFDQLLAKFRRQYDYVLIDTCPVFAADEATSLAPKVDATLLVVRNRFSRLGQVREALDLLYQRRAKVLGVVFNRTNAKAHSYYYYTDRSYHVPVRSHR
jgi:polysaccharide biosynthesis transport protein